MDNNLPNKKQLRQEKKRKQLAALLEIANLNEKDRQAMTLSQCEGNSTLGQNSVSRNENEPVRKKLKSNDGTANQSDDNERTKLSEVDLAELRSLLRKRRNELKSSPILSLREPTGFQAELDVPAAERIPIFFSDLQQLALFSVLNKNSPFIPRWCELQSSGHLSAVQILFIEGAGISDYLQSKDSLTSLSETNFPFRIEVVMPAAYSGSLIEEFCSIPLSRNQCNNLVSAYGSLEDAVKSSCEVFKVLQAFFPVEKKSDPSNEKSSSSSSKGEKSEESNIQQPEPTIETCHEPEPLPDSDTFPRTSLLLSAWQMIEEGYPIPINAKLREKYKDFVQTKPSYKEVNNFSPMYGVDCEMCTTTANKSECTRVSIVNEKLETVLDTLVLPYNKITNYLTRFSGITAAMMKGVTTRLEDVQKFIQENLEPDAILVGQSLNFDLIALKIMHPYCIDTSVIFNVTGDRYRKSKLSYLSQHFLNEAIQTGHKGHCSVEDSSASLRLVQLKLSQSIAFGDQVLTNLGFKNVSPGHSAKKQKKEPKEKQNLSGYATSFFSHATRMGRDASILACPEILEKYMDYLNPKIASYEQINDDGSCQTFAKNETSSDTGRVTCVIVPSNKSVAEGLATKTPTNFLSVGHIQLSEHESNALATRDAGIVNELNNWITEMQKTAPIKSLSVVVLCGREKSSNGVCFINLRKQKFEKVQFKRKQESPKPEDAEVA